MSEEDTMQNEICLACNRIKSEHQSGPLGEKIYCGGHLSSLFHPSGNVSVPASFIDKVRALVDDMTWCDSEDIDLESAQWNRLPQDVRAVSEALDELDRIGGK